MWTPLIDLVYETNKKRRAEDEARGERLERDKLVLAALRFLMPSMTQRERDVVMPAIIAELSPLVRGEK